MDYIVCQEPGHFHLKSKKIPSRKKNEALLKIHKVGICGTDLHAFAGRQPFFSYPRILGHELAVTVEEIDANPQNIKPGDKVVIIPYIHCGKCHACRMGHTNCCSKISVIGVHQDGGMQEYLSVSTNLLIPSPELTLEQMAIVEPLAIGAHALRRAAIKKEMVVLVIGCGPIGIGIMQLAKLQGARVIAMDIHAGRLEYVREKIGISHTVNASQDPVATINQLTNQNLADAVIDATGSKPSMEGAHQYLAHGGKLVLVGIYNGEFRFHHPTIHAKETSLLCSRNATREDFEYVMKVINEFPIDDYLTHRAHYKEMIDQFNDWLNPEFGVIKAMIDF